MRQRPPNRREVTTDFIFWPPPWRLRQGQNGQRIHIAMGCDGDGRAVECFLRGKNIGSDRDLELDDVGVTISRLLQHGDTVDEVARGLGRVPVDDMVPESFRNDFPLGQPASMFGAVIDKLVALQAAEMAERGTPPAGASLPSVHADVPPRNLAGGDDVQAPLPPVLFTAKGD